MTTATAQPSRKPLSEDWIATWIGLLLVLIIGSGALGNGAQTATLNAAENETATRTLTTRGTWQVSATLNTEPLATESLPTQLSNATAYTLTCADGALTVESAPAPELDGAQLSLDNTCAGALSVSYRQPRIIPWPLFNMFGR